MYRLPEVSVFALAILQGVSFTILSRSRNRSSMSYHFTASVFANGVWFLTFRQLMLSEMSVHTFVAYTLGMACGSLAGAKASMLIEGAAGAST